VLLETLAAGGVAAGAHYPTTLPSQPAFAKLDLPAAHCPRAEAWAASCIALPLFPGITVEQQTRVAEVLASAR
jgi:dTDP-4-amino-4,6-dideoxygalactose transaminase